jgi:anthranilate synthase component 2
MKVLLIDNYDSFTYNLFHLLDQFDGVDTNVARNDEIGLDEVKHYDRIIISPGPGIPSEAGISINVIKKYYSTLPILGVCLGMQAMAEAFNGRIGNSSTVFHGVALETIVTVRSEKLFKEIPSPFKCGRYHSWIVDPDALHPSFQITAIDNMRNVMAITHENQLLRGVQFHPESILTDYGKKLMANWLFTC